MRAAGTLLAILAVSSCEIPSQRDNAASEIPIAATFDSLTGRLGVVGVRSASIMLDWASTKEMAYEIPSIDGDDVPDLVRYFSTNYYGSIGQRSGDVVIYSRNIRADQVKSDVRNLVAEEYPIIPRVDSRDAGFANIRWAIRRLNSAQGKPLCDDSNGYSLLNALRQGACYVSCSGQSMIAADLMPDFARVVLLYADSTQLNSNMTFMQSEWHTTVEYVHNNRWYVADPTFGFAFVTDSSGRRIDTSELIDALMHNRAKDLTFAVARLGKIHAVPGKTFVEREPMLSSMYYTPDKRIEYVARY